MILSLNDAMNMSVKMASHELGKADESILKLVEKHKMQRRKIFNKMHQSEKQLATKQAQEMIQELEEILQAVKHMGDDKNEAVKQTIKEMSDNLEEMKSEFEGKEQKNSALMKKERQSNYDIQATRKKLITGLTELLNAQTYIVINIVGKLEEMPFMNVCKQRYSANEAMAKATNLCSRWQKNVEDPEWHPFKKEETGDKAKEVVDEEDEYLEEF